MNAKTTDLRFTVRLIVDGNGMEVRRLCRRGGYDEDGRDAGEEYEQVLLSSTRQRQTVRMVKIRLPVGRPKQFVD